MIDIQWKGKIGYGDIVSPICYAHNVSYKLRVPVHLTFRWDHGYDHKIDPSDPEPLWQRASFIDMLCEKEGTDVVVRHKFNSPLKINHSNYDWEVLRKDRLHNYWYPAPKPHDKDANLIVINSTVGNKVSLQDYGKPWKDPIADKWEYVTDLIKQRYRVEIVDYRTPIRELVFLLKRAKGFVGYHGTAAWVAKFLHTPSVIFAEGGSLTRNAFPYATVIRDTTSLRETIGNIEEHLEASSKSIIETIGYYDEEYYPSLQFIDHLQHDTTT